MADLHRLIAPRSIALIGAGAWTDAVAAGSRTIGFRGPVWRVHPTRDSTPETPYYRSVDDLPGVPDAAFLAVPNRDAPGVAGALAARGAGGFVCFTAGFSETATPAGARLTAALESGAADLPFFGPNCYGFVNFLDRAALWPDQVVGPVIERGVALICQSGTIALTLMFNDRSLPLGYVFTVGNQTRIAVEDLIGRLSDDPRVTAFGLYLEGIKDPARFAAAAAKARAAGKPIAIVKSGRTAAAARTAHSHTGALAGADAVFEAFCRQAGLARCDTLGTLCETLKLLHLGGPLPGRKVLVMGASGGDMAMSADVARHLDLDAVGFMLDCPPEGRSDTSAFDAVIDVFIAAAAGAPTRAALISSLPETTAARVRENCLRGGVVPLQGQREALEALALAGAVGTAWSVEPKPELRRPSDPGRLRAGVVRTLAEDDGKAALAAFGLATASGRTVPARDAVAAAVAIGFPVVMKAVGAHLEHKTEVGAVILNVRDREDAAAAAGRLERLSDRLLVEPMIDDGVAEILAGVIVDPQFGQVLVVGAGGILAELLADSVSLLPPWDEARVAAAIGRLGAARLLAGWRAKPGGDLAALVAAVTAVGRYAAAHLETLVELDVNPIIVRPDGKGAVAVDALIRLLEK
jgi:acetyl-CoA synthetase